MQRIGYSTGGVALSSINGTLHSFVHAVNCELKNQYLCFPDSATLRQNAATNMDKYKLPDFTYAVDGVHFCFEKYFFFHVVIFSKVCQFLMQIGLILLKFPLKT